MKQTTEQLLEAVAEHLGLEIETLERVGLADPLYFRAARQEIAQALKYWDDDQKIPVCLYCGSPRVDWIEETASYRCQVCGSEEERAAEGRKVA
jgi:DNA-directed RNA polymerase subunit RPC12/RpoP